MPVVGMPDGTQVSFPDDMPPDRIRALISQKFPDAVATVTSAPAAGTTPAAPNVPAPNAGMSEFPQESGPAHYLKLGVQALGQAGKDVAEFGTMLNPLAMASRSAEALGVEGFPKLYLSGEDIGNAAETGARSLGYEPAEPIGFKEKALQNIIRFGAQGLGGGLGLARIAARRAPEMAAEGAKAAFGDTFLAPYLKSPVKAVIGDTLAGGGAGAAVTAPQELMSPELRAKGGGSVGAAADLAALLAGATTAGGLYGAATGAPTTIARVFRNTQPAREISLEPGTLAPTSNKVADEAARFLQGLAINPAVAAERIGSEAAAAREAGLPIPTTGLISGDTGLEAFERGQRRTLSTPSIFKEPGVSPEAKAKYSFGERDTALRDQALKDVESIRPEGAKPEAFPARAEEVAGLQREAATRGVQRAEGRIGGVERAMEGRAADLTANQGEGVGASRNIDQMVRGTREAEHEQSRGLFNAPELTRAEVPVDPLVETADTIRAQGTRAAPLDPIVQKYTERFRFAEPADEAAGTPARPGFEPGQGITMAEVERLRPEIEADIAANRGNGAVVRQLRSLKETLNQYAEGLAAEGSPAGEAARAALTNYSERVAPTFREGVGGEIDKSIKRGANLRESETAGKFLTRPEDAADLMRIAGLRGNEAETARNARTWLFDQLSRTGVVKDGEIDPGKLTRWRNINGETLNTIPGLRAEVDRMVRDSRRGVDIAAQYADDLQAAQGRLRDVEAGIAKGPLGAVAGKSPEKAVEAVFASGNPEQAMLELKRTLGGTAKNLPETEAVRGLKAAVADRFIRKVSDIKPEAVSEGEHAVNFSRLVKEFDKNRKALSAVFSPEEMNALTRAQKMLEPLTKRQGQATVGSQTAENLSLAWRPLEVGLRLKYGMLKGGGIMSLVKKVARELRGNTQQQVDQVLARVAFDPELAQHLLTRKVADVGTPAWNAKLQKLIRYGQAARDLTQGDEQ